MSQAISATLLVAPFCDKTSFKLFSNVLAARYQSVNIKTMQNSIVWSNNYTSVLMCGVPEQKSKHHVHTTRWRAVHLNTMEYPGSSGVKEYCSGNSLSISGIYPWIEITHTPTTTYNYNHKRRLKPSKHLHNHHHLSSNPMFLVCCISLQPYFYCITTVHHNTLEHARPDLTYW